MDVKGLISHAPEQVTPYFDIGIYLEGSNILMPDTKNLSLYPLLEETAEVYQYTLSGMFTSLYRYGKNSCFDEVELYCENRATLGAPAIDAYKIVKLSRKGVGTWIRRDNGLHKSLLHQMALEIVENSDVYIRSSPMGLRDHVLYCLYRYDRMGTLSDLTKGRLMNKVCIPIRSLNRVLTQYREEGLVAYDKYRFRIVDEGRFLDAVDKLVGDQR